MYSRCKENITTFYLIFKIIICFKNHMNPTYIQSAFVRTWHMCFKLDFYKTFAFLYCYWPIDALLHNAFKKVPINSHIQ